MRCQQNEIQKKLTHLKQLYPTNDIVGGYKFCVFETSSEDAGSKFNYTYYNKVLSI